jgi:hypothetical protein
MSILINKSTKFIPQGMTCAKANFDVSVDAVKELLVACKGIEPSLA